MIIINIGKVTSKTLFKTLFNFLHLFTCDDQLNRTNTTA